MNLARGPREVDVRLGLVDLRRVGRAFTRLRRALEQPALQAAKRAHHEARATSRQLVVQLARRHLGAYGDGLGQAHRAGIKAFLHAHHHNGGLGVAGHDGPLDGRRSAPARQRGGVQVEAAEARRSEDRPRQQQPVGDDDRGIRIERGKFPLLGLRA